MADALALGAGARKGMEVQLLSRAPITKKIYTKEFSTNVEVEPGKTGLKIRSTILLNQIRTIDKSRITKSIGSLDSSTMNKVDLAIKISLGLID